MFCRTAFYRDAALLGFVINFSVSSFDIRGNAASERLALLILEAQFMPTSGRADTAWLECEAKKCRRSSTEVPIFP